MWVEIPKMRVEIPKFLRMRFWRAKGGSIKVDVSVDLVFSVSRLIAG